MARDALVDLVLLHNTPRYVATGVDPNDLQRITAKLERWNDWCRIWCDEASRHEQQGEEALARGRTVTAAECFLRAAIYFHYAKHLFAHDEEQYLGAQTRMLRCYRAAAPQLDPRSERIEIPFENGVLPANLRRPRGREHGGCRALRRRGECHVGAGRPRRGRRSEARGVRRRPLRPRLAEPRPRRVSAGALAVR